MVIIKEKYFRGIYILFRFQQKEREELERQLQKGKEEEEKYKLFAEKATEGLLDLSDKHPFRKVLERYDCHCPPFNQ